MDQGRSLTLRTAKKPKDISETLGKLPPQALDLEESTLGAVILQSTALEKIVSFLKPEHFYTDQHREVFSAVMALYRDGSPVDMRTVVDVLRKTGKIEMIGGATYIAELTSKVSSAANVEYHARVIFEMSLKRSMIGMANKIHEHAYEDTTDVFEMLEKTVADWNYLKTYSIPENKQAKIKELWLERDINKKPDVPPPLVFIDQTAIVSPGDHTLVVGKKKSRKTLLISHFIDLYFKNRGKNPKKVIIFDTEQSKMDVWRARERIKVMTGMDIMCLYLRGMSPKDRKAAIADTLRFWECPVDMIIIDGVRDLMSNINDPDESTDLIYWLEDLTVNYNMGIVNVLHLNKTDNQARGHIGTELANKTICTIEVEYDTKTGYSVAKCESARSAPFTSFSFTHGSAPDFLYQEMGMPTNGTTVIAPADRNLRLEAIFADGPVKYPELIEEVKAEFAVGKTRAESLVKDFIRAGLVLKSGKPRDPNTIYKYLGSNGHHPQENIPPPQQEIFAEASPDDLPF